MSNPLLAPQAQFAWRDAAHLLIEDPAVFGASICIGNADRPHAHWLRSIDGSRSVEQLLVDAAGLGIDGGSAVMVMRELEAVGLLGMLAAPPHVLADVAAAVRPGIAHDLQALTLSGRDADCAYRLRQSHHIWIEGSNRVAHALVDVLSAAHVGSLQVRAGHTSRRPVSLFDLAPTGPFETDLGTSPVVALRRHIANAHPEQRPGKRRQLVVAVDSHLDPADDVAFQEAGVPYLRVLTSSRHATIGPLTLPGVSACWSCLALHRSDADPTWPSTLAQFDQARRSLAPIDAVFAMQIAAEVGATLTRIIDSEDPSELVNTTLHVDRESRTVHRRSWRTHPDCPCQWQGPITR